MIKILIRSFYMLNFKLLNLNHLKEMNNLDMNNYS